MRNGKVIAAGILLFSLSLITVAVQDRVVLLRKDVYGELVRVHDLEGEVLAWWWKIREWRNPQGRERLLRLLGKKKDRPDGPETVFPAGMNRNEL